MWPFSTLGWPEPTTALKTFYPTNVLVTGFDIIFFWVARMIMMTLHLRKEVPFHTVYVHGLVRDGDAIEVRGVVVDEREHRGHRFVDVDIEICANDQPVWTAHHTAIWRPASAT